MKRSIVIAICCLLSYTVNADTWITTNAIVSYWDNANRNYKQYSFRKASMLVFFLTDRIKIKDKAESVYYTRGDVPDQKFDDMHIAEFICYDEQGRDCTVAVIHDEKTVMLVVTYKYEVQYWYVIEPNR